tara:strand:- start:188 stop:430 length:243 start_codon:yes stop_codon:yes gene_type:complete
MCRQRNNKIAYSIEVDTPDGEFKKFDNIPNLDMVAHTINKAFFNNFEVVSRPMVSNWLYYPQTPRRNYATNFNIVKYQIC